MAAKRVPKAPTLDGVAFEKPLRAAFPMDGGGDRPIYTGPLPKMLQWMRGDGLYEGGGVRDTVNANAQYLDEVKGDVDDLKPMVAQLKQKVAALEAQPHGNPFEG